MNGYRSRWIDGDVADLRELATSFFAAELTPHLERFDRQRRVDRELWDGAGAAGLLCCSVPEEFGGAGGSVAHDLAVIDAQAATGDTAFGNAIHSGVVQHYLLAYGTDEQRGRWLPDMVGGRRVGAIALSEPGAGSDLKALRTRAVRDADGYRISGAKTFISNGASADLVLVAASTDSDAGARGIGLFVVDAAAEGFRRGRVLDKLGMHGQDTSELFFDDVLVPEHDRLGAEGAGFAMLMQQLPHERLLIGVTAVASMELALAETIRYTKERSAFGGPLVSMQHVRFELAECATLVHAARVFLDSAVERHLAGALDSSTASMAKWWLTDLQGQVVDRCLQLFGGYGFMREYLISRLYADARAQRIYGGANEVMKELIARSL